MTDRIVAGPILDSGRLTLYNGAPNRKANKPR